MSRMCIILYFYVVVSKMNPGLSKVVIKFIENSILAKTWKTLAQPWVDLKGFVGN